MFHAFHVFKWFCKEWKLIFWRRIGQFVNKMRYVYAWKRKFLLQSENSSHLFSFFFVWFNLFLLKCAYFHLSLYNSSVINSCFRFGFDILISIQVMMKKKKIQTDNHLRQMWHDFIAKCLFLYLHLRALRQTFSAQWRSTEGKHTALGQSLLKRARSQLCY